MQPIQTGQPRGKYPLPAAAQFGARSEVRPLFGSNAKKDYYATLGVSRNASDEEIGREYKRLALEHHPDRNPDNPKAEERFKEISEAYATLKDPERRKRYDLKGFLDTLEIYGVGGKKSADGNAKRKEPSHFRHNARKAGSIFFTRIVPLLLSLPIGTGLPGILFSLTAGSLLSYLSGKLGRHLNNKVDPSQTSAVFHHYDKFEEVLRNPQNMKNGEVVDHFNNAKDELFNLFKLPIITDFLKKRMTLSATRGLGKFLNDLTMLKANTFSDIAQQDNVKDAAVAGVKGGFTYLFYYRFCRWLGGLFKRSGLGFMKAAGVALENAWLGKLAYDVARGSKQQPQPA